MQEWENLEGTGGKGGGRGDRDGEYMYIHGWFMSMYDKIHYKLKKKKEEEEAMQGKGFPHVGSSVIL